jgi:hypothetical protein
MIMHVLSTVNETVKNNTYALHTYLSAYLSAYLPPSARNPAIIARLRHSNQPPLPKG